VHLHLLYTIILHRYANPIALDLALYYIKQTTANLQHFTYEPTISSDLCERPRHSLVESSWDFPCRVRAASTLGCADALCRTGLEEPTPN
jgi:hypothetical protein